ncbi:Uncharacterised protein [Bordetella pertussis]|nr:Uncharacterised protein [Bordetella pertussis]CFM86791.1 Uncharacterised protein [Bordetella pertussis]CFO32776.1 Uncharacterised protein [Bordetella pertussis]CFT96988.1 Uncharacterised protein [Bordetella pertussis]CFW34113.1 Uncharacterised protein [Bordetella pertussis]
MPLDLVAAVRCLPRLRASSNANFSTRSAPTRVNTLSWITTSRSVPANSRPPLLEYSPSVFSRTMKKSMSPGLRLASGVGTPGISLTGRRLMYWSKSRRKRNSDPHSASWSGTASGQPMAPKKIASWPPICAAQSSGIILPWRA